LRCDFYIGDHPNDFNNKIDSRRIGQFHEWLKETRKFKLPSELELEEQSTP